MVVGLCEWPKYTHEEMIDAIRMLSLKYKHCCQDKDRVKHYIYF